MKTVIPESTFKALVLPNLAKSHPVAADRQKHIADTYTVMSDDGKAEVEFKVEADPTPTGANFDGEALVKSIVSGITKGLEPLAGAVDRLPRIEGGGNRNDDEGKWGFTHPAEYLKAIHFAGQKSHPVIDKRLTKGLSDKDAMIMKAAATTFSAESPNTDGGFTVPPDFRNMILGDEYENDNFLGLCDSLVTGSNNVTIPTDETTPWEATGGVQAYWTGEAGTYTQSKLALNQVNTILAKLTALVPVTDELLSDSPMLAKHMQKKVTEKINFKIGEAVFRGSGVGMPLGFLNSTAPVGPTITVAAESGQTAKTIVYANVNKMRQRVMPASQSSSKLRWFIQPDCFPQIQQLTLGNYPIWTPPTGGAAAMPFGALLGIPIVQTQHCQTVGTIGDIILADLSQYIAVTKGNSITAQTSIHLWFDQDLTAYKFTFRMAGQPWRSTPVPSQFGTNTLSYFVDLATRS